MSSNENPVEQVCRRILFVGPQWHGSDAAGLARAFRRLGHIVSTVDPDVYFPSGRSFPLKVARKCLVPLFTKEMNAEIVHVAKMFQPELLVVFKGTNVLPQTLKTLKDSGVYLTLFYPDVSFLCHGPHIPRCMPLYDWIFTTKSFGVTDLRKSLGISNTECLLHGFDSDIHRPFPVGRESLALFESDASFIGTWSPKKELFLAEVARRLPSVRLRVWGYLWEKATQGVLQPTIQGMEIHGDVYPLAIQCSKINIALLSEARLGASSGDQVTSRTFNIPASGGFMLHERTDEFLECFREGKEAACFGSPDELVQKIEYYLDHEEERERIRLAGYRHCIAEHSLDRRAQRIINHYNEHMISLDRGK